MPNFLKQYKDKDKARRARNRQRKRNYDQTAIYEPREWTASEDSLVLEHSMSDRELSKLIKRGTRAIQVRRCRLKKELENA